MTASSERIDRIDELAARVRWLDRNRRRVAVVLGLAAAIGVYSMLAVDWPRVHAVALCGACGVVAWSLTEIALAWFTAVWETECDQLTTDRGLPRAIVRK